MATAILKLTEAQLRYYFDLAGNSGNQDHIKQHGIPVEGDSPVTYAVARQISGSGEGRTLEFLVQVWGRSAHSKDNVQIPMHLEMQANNGLVKIALHDGHPNSQSVERICVEASSEHIPLDSLPDELLVGYTIPSVGLPQRIMSLVFSDAQNSKILRFFGSAVPKFTEYIIPNWYKDAHVYLSQVKGIFGLSEFEKKRFSRETQKFKGTTSARKALLADVVREAEKRGMMTPERYQRLLEEAELPEQAKIRSSSMSHTTVKLETPDIKYESVLRNPGALLPDDETVVYILGLKQVRSVRVVYRRHPWIKEDGTIGALERYVRYVVQISARENAEQRKLRLDASLERLRKYEANLRQQAYSYTPRENSQFAKQLNSDEIKKGTFIYYEPPGSIPEVGTLEGFVLENSKIIRISVNFPNQGRLCLVVNQKEFPSYWSKDKPVPADILLPDGTKYIPKPSMPSNIK